MNQELIKKASGHLYRCFLTSFFFVILCFFFAKPLHVMPLRFSHIVIGVLLIAFFTFFKSQKLLFRIFLVIAVLSGLFLLHLIVGFQRMLLFYRSYGSWLLGMETEQTSFLSVYPYLQILLLSLLTYIAFWLFLRFRFFLPAVFLFLLSVLFGNFFLNLSLSKPAVALTLSYEFLLAVLLYRQHAKQAKETVEPEEKKRIYITFLFPVFLFSFLLLFLCPAPEKPYDWYITKRLFTKIGDVFTSVFYNGSGNLSEDFVMSMDGSGKNVTMDGSSENSGQVCMEISPQRIQTKNLYLNGFVYADFDGKNWSRSQSMDTNDTILDALETRYAVSCVTGYPHDYIGYASADIIFRYFHSRNQFLPTKTYRFTSPDRISSKEEEFLGYGAAYRIDFFEMNLSRSVFRDLLQNGHTEAPAIWDKVNVTNQSGDASFTYRELLDYRERVKDTYAQPVTLPSGLSELLSELFTDRDKNPEENSYKKLLLLENYLSSGEFTYTKNPDPLPDSLSSPEDFLSYFLLEEKEGYCTHFATAFVLLARSLGYPARLCQGFCFAVPDSSPVFVTEEMAHAWPEVYFEGIGFVPFEPTPGYEVSRYTGWELKDQKETASDWFDYDQYVKEKQEQRLEQSVKEEEKQKEKLSAGDTLILLRTIGLWVLFLAILSLVLYLLYFFGLIRSFRRKDQKKKLSWLFARNLHALSRLYRKREASETLSEYAACLHSAGLPGTVTCSLFEQQLYSKEEQKTESVSLLLNESKEILCLLAKRNKLRYQKDILLNRFLR